MGVSALDGTASESIAASTWNNGGDFYVRVRGRNGAFDVTNPFDLNVTLLTGACGNVNPILSGSTLPAAAGDFKTVILTDPGRMPGTAAEKALLADRLAALAARPEVQGVIVDVSADGKVSFARSQADANTSCPFAHNVLAATIKDIVTRYRDLNPLEYVVIAGSDDVIPFFRYPDPSPLAKESEYDIPVLDDSAAKASLRLDYVLGQDAYGARTEVSLQGSVLPIPDLAVGRLVETASEAITVLDAYLGDADGIVQPQNAFLSSYGFLEDGSLAVKDELVSGLGVGGTVDTLISPATVAPSHPDSWSAAELMAGLLGSRHDLVYLAGHFSHFSALAADYRSRLTVDDLLRSTADFKNALIYSSGCHSGYNLFDVEAGAAPPVDWAQAFARKGAVLIAGTGYQYGDSDLMEYSERLYLTFTQELGQPGAIPVGKALVAAKQAYLADTGVAVDGVFEKTILVSTLFGLPMFSVDFAGATSPPTAYLSPVDPPTPVPTGLGNFDPGLEIADITLDPNLAVVQKTLTSADDLTTEYTATYLEGKNGVTTRPADLILPLEIYDVSHPDGLQHGVLRGVGFRGGRYSDTPGIMPLVSAPATEMNGIHQVFNSRVHHPSKPWTVNYFDALADPVNGTTRLMLTPAQFLSDGPNALTGTLRQYQGMDFRLFYIDTIIDTALAAPPSLAHVQATSNGATIAFRAEVTDPIAGVQAVWVTYTGVTGPLYGEWQPLDLARTAGEPGVWEGTLTLPPGMAPENVRYTVQAANWIGLVTLGTNFGAYYTPNVDPGAPIPPAAAPAPTALTLAASLDSAAYASSITLQATLTSSGAPLAGQPISFSLGNQRYQATTNASGLASVDIVLLAVPGAYALQASYDGTAGYAAATVSAPLTLVKQDTTLQISLPSTSVPSGSDIDLTIMLLDATGRIVPERALTIVFDGGAAGLASQTLVTNYAGEAIIQNLALAPGTYQIMAYFSGQFTIGGQAYVLEDRFYNAALVTGALTITPGNAAPTTVDDSIDTGQDQAVSIGVLTNDRDVDGNLDPSSLSILTPPAYGTAAIAAGTGIITYQPVTGYTGVDTFRYQVCDTGGKCSIAVVTVVVTMAAPPANLQILSITVPQAPIALSGHTVPVSASVVVPHPGSTRAVWSWGDGTTSSGSIDANGTTATGSHSYSQPGVYLITLTLSEGAAAATHTATEYVVIYDSAAGFVTGGGWIDSQPGWCQLNALCAGAQGRANFGFVARYQRGSTVPVGSTQFQFQAGNFNYHASTYEWLVVNQGGTNAQFKGHGTINGQLAPNGTPYRFMIWAKDANPDTFRIKIWYDHNGSEVVVYDNGFHQPIGGGNIRVHR